MGDAGALSAANMSDYVSGSQSHCAISSYISQKKSQGTLLELQHLLNTE
jgi:hypothetical protein